MLTVLKLKQDKIYNIPSTGISIKSGFPTESPANPILVITSFTSTLNKDTLGLSFNIYFDVYTSPATFFSAYDKIHSSFVTVPESQASSVATVQVQPGSINLIDKVQELLFYILTSQPDFSDWEIGTITLP